MRKFFLGALVFLAILLFFQFKGVVYYDEGYIINAASRMAHGQIPYRDFDMVYTPLSYTITAGFFAIFGESIFISRITALIISLLSLFALHRILKLLTKNIVLHVGALLFFLSWGPIHINFVWPTMFALCAFLYFLLFYLLGIFHKQKKYFFLSGVMVILIFLSKQNFGIAIGGTSFLLLLIQSKKERDAFLFFCFGAATATVVYLGTLLVTNSFGAFFQNLYVYTYQRILVQKSLDTPFLYEGFLVERFLKLLFYFSPLIFSAIAFFVVRNTKQRLWMIPVFCAVFYVVGIRPTTDYIHLASLMSLTCLPLVLIITSIKKKQIQKVFPVILGVLTVLGFYTAYAAGYYKWDLPLREQNKYVDTKRIGISITKQRAENFAQVTDYIDTYTKVNEPIFVNYYAPLLYFLVNRQNPTRYDFFSPTELPLRYQHDTITVLEQQRVRLVVMHVFNKDENSLVAHFVKQHFHIGKTIGDWIIYIR